MVELLQSIELGFVSKSDDNNLDNLGDSLWRKEAEKMNARVRDGDNYGCRHLREIELFPKLKVPTGLKISVQLIRDFRTFAYACESSNKYEYL